MVTLSRNTVFRDMGQNGLIDTGEWPGTFRKLGRSDAALFRAHLLRLDPLTRQDRFAMGASDEFLARYAETAFALDTILFGYVEGDRMLASAELRMVSRREAEATFTVEEPARGRGIGSALFERVISTARQRRLKRLYMSCLARNKAMQHLARKFDAHLVYDGGDVLDLTETPAPPPQDRHRFATAILDLHPSWLGLRTRRTAPPA